MNIKCIGLVVAALSMVGVAHAASISWSNTIAATDGDYEENLSSDLLLADEVHPPLFINEFMAQNFTTLADPQGEYDDWIEMYNAGQTAIDLAGMYLTDDINAPTKWRIPEAYPGETTIAAGGFLVIWADTDTPDGPLHAAFQLAAGGEEIALFDTDGATLIDRIVFGDQTADVSWGRELDADADWVTLSPTPGSSNDGSYLGLVADTKFNVKRGFYDVPFDVTITCQTVDAIIYYTLDGSVPVHPDGTATASAQTYNTTTNRPHITTTTCLRAAAVKTGWKSSNIDTQTYLFLDDVINQPTNPAGFPSAWGSTAADYEMDPDIRNSAEGPQLKNALLSLPTICIVTDQDHLFDSGTGIYANSTMDGVAWERPASMEYFTPDGTKEYQINCGLRIQGGYFRDNAAARKHSFRLLFKGIYGATKMEFPLFESEEDAATSFDTLVLRAGANDGYSWYDMGTTTQYTRDQFGRSLQRDTGQAAAHGTYVHLYVNGLYWGLYNPVERPDGAFSSSYYEGDKEDWDVFKHKNLELNQGDRVALNQMLAKCQAAASSNDAYQELQGNNPDGSDNATYPHLLDVDNYIDYMIVNIWGGNWDWPWNNYWLARKRTADSTGFKFYCWDIEDTLGSPRSPLNFNCIAQSNFGQQVGQYHANLKNNAEYRMAFADHLHTYFFNGGILEPASLIQRYSDLADWIELSIIAESARWGDQHYSTPLGYSEWISQRNGILNTYLPQRSNIAMGQFRSAGLYPTVVAPSFNQHGGYADPGFEVTMSAPAGTIYYTLDGSDPRLSGGGINPQAVVYDGQTAQQTLIPKGAEWKYLDDGSNQGAAWINAGYSDTGWDAGNGELGYGDSIAEATVVGYIDTDPGTSGVQKNTTTYFRKTVNLSNVSTITALTLGLQRDDGAVVYINGQEVRRDNMPTGPVTYQSWASTAIAVPAESTYYNLSVDSSVLLEGDNVVAVEIHQASATSSDISFDMELVAQTSVSNSSAILLNGTTQIKARVLNGGSWSALNETIFAIGPIVENLRITEIMYHPQNDTNDLPNAEYIELQNIGTNALNLNLVRLTKGVKFTLPSLVVQPNECVLVVRDAAAFASAYPSFAGVIAGTWESGALLSDGGEKVRLEDALGSVIHDFKYKDSWYETTDGKGFSLTIKNALATDLTLWDQKAGWRPSAVSGGSPGTDDSGQLPALGSIVINEVLAHSHSTAPDWIELYNTTPTAIHIGGWFLSDDNSGGTNTMKYEIPPGTTIPAGGYQVFYENVTFGNNAAPGCHVPFGLSEGDDQIYLHSGLEGAITGYVEEESFGASEQNTAFGRHYKASTDSYNFVAMSANTPGAANAYPKVGPIVISEIMYNPDSRTNDTYDHDAYEYVVLHNITASPVTLEKLDENDIPWKFTGGIDYTFPINTVIPADGSVVIAKNLAAYAERYGSSAGVLGPYDGKLNNGGEKLDLSMPGDEEPGQLRYYILVDRVNYSDGSHPLGEDPWPVPPDGTGEVLMRTYDELYGNDVANWLPDADADGIANDLDPDDDNDGIPDDWEIEKGLNPLSDESGDSDSDSDQFDDWYEYMADTDPLDGSSFQTFWMEPYSGSTVAFRFSTSIRRRYTVTYRNDLLTGSWSDLAPTFNGTGSETNIVDSAAEPQRYYRLKIDLL